MKTISILKRKLTLTEDHRRIVTVMGATALDDMIQRLRSKMKPAVIYINDQKVTLFFNIWHNHSLEIGQEIIIEARID